MRAALLFCLLFLSGCGATTSWDVPEELGSTTIMLNNGDAVVGENQPRPEVNGFFVVFTTEGGMMTGISMAEISHFNWVPNKEKQ